MSNDIQEIVMRINEIANTAKTEEDLRLGCESVLRQYLPAVGIDYNARYEVSVASGRIDALFQHVVVEYKAPGKLSRASVYQEAAEKALSYVSELADQNNEPRSAYVAVIMDGRTIGFTRYNLYDEPVIFPPMPLGKQSVVLYLRYLRSLNFKALSVNNILGDFGPESQVARNVVALLWTRLMNRRDIRTNMLFNEWRRLFGQVSGFGGNTGPERAVAQVASTFGVDVQGNHAEFIFVLHTYYSLIIKLIALFILERMRMREGNIFARYITGSLEEHKQFIVELEDGAAFRKLGISNFLEGDFFSWYINEWTPQMGGAVKSIVQTLSDYEPSTPSLMPEAVRDLLKRLYEQLVPKQIRHDLGEFYTPDWLAEYTIFRSGMRITDRVLDPTCGSGTFLVLTIKEKMKLLEQMSPNDLVEHILTHVYGFDLNPLAVIASRTNYLIALGDLLEAAPDEIEIPVYLTDAILSPRQVNHEYIYRLDTDNGALELCLPEEVVAQGKLGSILAEVENLVILTSRGNYTEVQAVDRLRHVLEGYEIPSSYPAIENLFYRILDLERRNWNRIWCRVIKNHFSSAMLSDFDVIIGNPPWLRWSALPESYRNTIKPFCVKYGLFSKDTFVGGIETDVSTMVLYAAAEKWLKNGGRLAFLITRTVFKNESSEGFRKFTVPHREEVKFKVERVEDFTDLKPFEGAVNKPSLVVLRKGNEKTEYPLPWVVWRKTRRKNVGDSYSLRQALEFTTRNNLIAHPLYPDGGPWLTVNEHNLRDCLSLVRSPDLPHHYPARKGICSDRNGIYYGRIVGVRGRRHVIFENDPSLGRDRGLPVIRALVEKELIYPIARGREVSSFNWTHEGYFGILPQKGMDGFPEDVMRTQYPRALAFFTNFENETRQALSNRASYRRYHMPRQAPVYSCWNVGQYTFAPYKVCWPEVAADFRACVLSSVEADYWSTPRVIIPDHKIYYVPLENETEAHYLCAFLNSPQVEEFILGYVERSQIGTHVTEYLNIPQFDLRNNIHIRLAQVSKRAHAGTLCPKKALQMCADLVHSALS